MRGADTFTESLFTMRRLEDFVPETHPLRPMRKMVNHALKNIEPLLSGMYAADIKGGRPSIAPEKLLRAMLLQIFYSIRSERMLMEQTQYNLLYRWFIGLSMDDSVWVPTVFTKNRERLIEHDAVIELFNEVLAIANQNGWLSGEHFSVDGTLIQAWAGHKSFTRKDGSDDDSAAFKGQRRSNDTHESTTDADARLYRKGKTASELRFMGHTLSDNRHGLISSAMVTQADGYAEREAAKVMISNAKQAADEAAQITLGADKGYDAAEFIEALTDMKVVPHAVFVNKVVRYFYAVIASFLGDPNFSRGGFSQTSLTSSQLRVGRIFQRPGMRHLACSYTVLRCCSSFASSRAWRCAGVTN